MGSNAFQPTNNIMHVFVNEVIDDVEVLEVGYTHLQSMQEAVHDGLCGLYGYRQDRQESVRWSLCISRRQNNPTGHFRHKCFPLRACLPHPVDNY